MHLIKKPHHTEKSLSFNKDRKYTFIVDRNATKNEIRKYVAQHYKVVVDAVNTIQCKGKEKNIYTRKRVFSGKQRDYKKAIVTLAPDNLIDIYADTL